MSLSIQTDQSVCRSRSRPRGKRKFHVVFLIDASLSKCDDCSHCDEIVLIAYRILSAVKENSRRKTADPEPPKSATAQYGTNGNDVDPKGNDSPDVYFKWGYKLFSSVETLPRSKHDYCSFQNLNQSQLNKFETKLCSALKSKAYNLCDKNSAKRRSLSHPSQLFGTALTETLHDFSWSDDDVFSSPATGRKRNFSPDYQNAWSNMVFLISKAPHTEKEMRQFSNKRVVDSEIFVDSFMTPALLKEYQDRFNIIINWIDMSSSSCSQISGIAYSQNCRHILHETCSKLGGKFLFKNSILGCIPVDKNHKVSKELGGKIVQPGSAFWVPAESHTVDILCGETGFHHEPQPGVPYSAIMSVLCFGLKDVPVNLIPMSKRAISRRNNLGSEISSRKLLTCDEISGASLTLAGLVQLNNVNDELYRHSLQSFILTAEGCEAMTHFFQTLETSNTVGLVNVTLKNKMSKGIAVIQSQLNVHSLTFLNMTLHDCQQLAASVTYIEEKEGHSGHLDTVSESHGIKHVLASFETLKMDKRQECLKTPKSYACHQIFQSHCLNCWHLPGSTKQMSAVAANLQDKMNESRSFLKNEKDALKKLKQFYAKERQPRELIQDDQPVLNTPLCATRRSHQKASGGSEQSLKGHMKRTPSSILQRGRLMVDRARSANILSSEDNSDSFHYKPTRNTPETPSSTSTGFKELWLKSESDLQVYLKDQYEQILKATIATEISVKAMVTVTSQFMASKDFSDPQKAAANFIQDHLSLKPAELKAKYQTELGSTDAATRKTVECKLQVLVVMETESLLRNNSVHSETLTDRIVDILRVLSFSSGATELKLFLKDIVDSYSATLPKLLVDIYDELMLPLPLALKKIASPAGPSSVLTRSFDHDTSLSSAPNSSQPSSILSDSASQQMKRSSRFKQHPSFADYRQKKQILVKPVQKPQSKGKATHSGKEKSRTRSSSPQKRYGGECDKAKRNLFSEHRPKVKTSKIRERHSKSHRKRRHSLSTTDKARTLVLSTPVHKQKSGWHIQQQERRRLRDKVQSDVNIVAESPVKESELEPKAGIEKPARYLLRQAFYSSNSQQSRNFAKAVEQSQNTDGFPISEISYEKYPSTSKRTHGTLASAVRGESPLLSPRSRLLKTLMPSPSPAPKSQKQTSQMSTPGRPSKRLAKKLDFSNVEASSSTKPREPHVLDAQLIFDGENAIDFDIMKSPSKKMTTHGYKECLKTPEKQIKQSRPDMWSSASCPPPSLSTTSDKASVDSSSGLNFKNTLFQNAESMQDCLENQQNKTPHVLNKNIRKTPNKQSPSRSPKSPSLTSPGQASLLRSNLFSKSPKKFDPFAYSSEKQSFDESFSGHDDTTQKMQTRRERMAAEREGECSKYNLIFDIPKNIEPSTPKKSSSGATNPTQFIQSTPSKVKFFDEYLISPPTGSGYPPSAEKSTPGKSILKGSPSMRKVKMPRRIQLQLVGDLPSKMTKELERTSKENQFDSMKSQAEAFGSDNEMKSSTLQDTFYQSKKEGNQKKYQRSLEDVESQLNETEDLTGQAFGYLSHEKDENTFSIAQSTSGEISNIRPAAIQIRTPSPSAKKSMTIQSWARRKKCSPKQNSKSPTASILSPTSSSSSSSNASCSDGKSKAPLSTVVAKENEIISADSGAIKGKGKQITRKRGLFHVNENEEEVKMAKSKRLKVTSTHSHDFHSSPFKTHNIDIESKGHPRAYSPELFEAEADNEHISNSSFSRDNFRISQRSWSPSSHHMNPSVSHRSSPLKRLTRQSSNLSGDGSLGFPNPVPSHAISSQSSGNKLYEKQPSHSELEKETPSGSNCTPRKKESSTSPKSPGKKQYSPALSTFGLASLIKSPFVASQSVSPESNETKRSEQVKPKSRKQLDLS